MAASPDKSSLAGRPGALNYGLQPLGKLLQLIDQLGDHAEAAVPELGIAGVQPERGEQFGVMLGAAGREHVEIALGEAGSRMLVDRVERIHHAVAERVGVDVERRMDEVRDVA